MKFADLLALSQCIFRNTEHNNARINKSCGGSCILVKDGMDFIAAEDLKIYNIETQIEYSCIVSKSLKVIIICIYRPPKGLLELFYEQLTQILEKCLKSFKNYKIILNGDFNIDLFKNTTHKKMFLDLLHTYNISQTVFEATRVTKSTKSLVDNIFINFENMDKGEVLFTALSDHHGQMLGFYSGKQNEVKLVNHYKKIYSQTKINDFKYELSVTQWNDVIQSHDVNIAYNLFINKIINLNNLIFVPKLINNKNNSKHAWMTRGIKKSCNTKRILFKKKIAGEIPANDYLKYSKILKSVIIESKKQANIAFIKTSVNKGKATWSLVNKYTGSGKIKNRVSVLESTETFTLDNINQFFVDACPDITPKNQPRNVHTNIKNSLFLSPTYTSEVYNCIMSLKNTKSVGEDGVPVILLKNIADIIQFPLTHIINISLSTGKFPENLKISQIRAIYKNGEKHNIGNYRPIALLSNVSKIFEKIIYKRIIEFIDNNHILTNVQNGFRKQKSTTRAMYQALCEIIRSLNDRKSTVTMSLDLSKAFDSVDHSILLKKLEGYGIRGEAIGLMESYLHGRKQYVAELDTSGNLLKSDLLCVKRGVPQGSILGPLLFILYINDLPTAVDESMILFADDTSLIFKEKDKEHLKIKIENTLDTLENWFTCNNLTLNVDKTKFIKFSFITSTDDDFSLDRGATIMKPSQHFSFLGIGLDSRLDWRYHIDTLAGNMAKYSYAPYPACTYMSL